MVYVYNIISVMYKCKTLVILFFARKLKLYEEQELTMQVFCDLENKDMPNRQDNIVVYIQFTLLCHNSYSKY